MVDLRDSEHDFLRLLRSLEPRTSFAEVFAERREGESVTVDSKSVSCATSPRLSGFVVRAWGGDRWLEAAASAFDGPAIAAATEEIGRGLAHGNARSAPPGPSASTVGTHDALPARPMRDMGMEAIVEFVRGVFRWSTSVPGVAETQAVGMWSDDERYYLNTAGARCFQRVSRVRAGVAPIAIENGRSQLNFFDSGGIGGQEILEGMTEEGVQRTAKRARELLDAKAPPTGPMNVVLDPGVTSTFAHESFGHGTEADQFVRSRSYLQPILGEMVGPEFLSIVDDGSIPGAWGSVYYDDEGHPGQRTALIDHGRFVGALHDRESAALLHAAPTGNTRRSDFLSRAFVRMTNTLVVPGDWTADELVKEARDGVLLERWTSGMEDPAGGQMQLKVLYGHRIEHGQLTDLVSSMALSGTVLQFLRDIRGTGSRSDFEITAGSCGKGHGDYLNVGDGGSYLLSRALVGPA
jgi:TldD protein